MFKEVMYNSHCEVYQGLWTFLKCGHNVHWQMFDHNAKSNTFMSHITV